VSIRHEGAPVIGDDWQAQLRQLEQGWDSYGAEKISDVAIASLEAFAAVPRTGGGIQLEAHRDCWDIEICIDAEGRIESVLVAKEPNE
jgi:hypothetical protein